MTIGAAGHCESKRDQAEKAIAAVRRLAEDVGFPSRLRDIGVKEENLAEIARISVDYPQTKTNCRLPSLDGVEKLLHNLY